ncbi:MAG TPA: hypothetical protein VIN71_12085 [Pseudomonadales bacterium]
MSGNQSTQQQLQLAEQAAQGDAPARNQVNALADPMIRFQTDRFCKRFCRENRYRYRCTLIPPWGGAPTDAALCEWGNASYAWMLDDLTGSKRLLKYQARNGASLFDYLYQIANSRPFYERWKDWRFGRRVQVPSYIQDMGPTAARVFLGLRAHDEIDNIAQKLGCPLTEIQALCQRIIALLTQKRRLHLLNPPSSVSLTENHHDDPGGEHPQLDIASHDEPAELHEEKQMLRAAWKNLDAVEQFVLEALVIEEQDASQVLQALQSLGVSIKKGVAPADTDRQQLYYFRRKTLLRLARLMEPQA